MWQVNNIGGFNQDFLEVNFKVNHDTEERNRSEKGEDDEVEIFEIIITDSLRISDTSSFCFCFCLDLLLSLSMSLHFQEQ